MISHVAPFLSYKEISVLHTPLLRSQVLVPELCRKCRVILLCIQCGQVILSFVIYLSNEIATVGVIPVGCKQCGVDDLLAGEEYAGNITIGAKKAVNLKTEA